MVDLHSHVMYGWDDGAKTIDESLEMARVAAENGTTVLAATPHMYYGEQRVEPDMVRERVAEINERITAEGLDIRIVVGTEMVATWEALMPLTHKKVLTLNDSRTVLLEFPFTQLPIRFKELIFQVRMANIMPLMAHPERCQMFIQEPGSFEANVEPDLPIQINTTSLMGGFGEKIQNYAWKLVEEDRPIVIASDAHNAKSRPPILSEVHAALTEKYGEEIANIMCRDNPRAVIENKGLRIARMKRKPAPEPKGFRARLKRLIIGRPEQY
ncbi:MAG TPA: hypothetical protein PKK84_06190 [Armatimonadota bacterium]|nr:hypothetical protein [Armatimonadota bacterium]